MPADERLASLKIDRSERPRRRWLPWAIAALLLVAVAGVTWTWVAVDDTPAVRTAVAREVRLGEAQTVLEASGYVTARRQATVSAKVTGQIVEVLIEEGMHVQEGQLMARLDPSMALENLRLAEAQVEAGRTALTESEVRLRKARLDLQRLDSLRSREIVSQAEVDAAQAEVDALQARIDQQQQEVDVAERRVSLWRQEIADREIRAPFAGVVVSKDAQPGEMISPMSAGGSFTRTGIGTIVDMESLEVEVDVNESYINRVTPGQPVEAVLDAYPDWTIPARVIAIVPTADRQRATVKVRIAFEQLDPRILPDMAVKVAFREQGSAGGSEPRPTAIAVPETALRGTEGQRFVYVLRDGVLEQRSVSVAEARGGQAVLDGGVRAGERVVVEGPPELAGGMAVREARQ